MTSISDVVNFIHTVAPPQLQESYDNAGLSVGDASQKVTGITICLDITEDVIKEAVENGDNLIISHHPIIFSGLKRLTGSNYVERCVMLAIKHNVALFSAHTNLDNVFYQGVNSKFCQKLGLINCRILAPKGNTLKKLTTFIPKVNTEDVMEELHMAGGGNIGNYAKCSFRVTGTGHFTPNDRANPVIGSADKDEMVEENRVEMIFPAYLESNILRALNAAHPYEEVAHFIEQVDNKNQEVGSGMVGELATPMKTIDFLQFLKEKFELKVIKHTNIVSDQIKTVGVCGGSGSFLLPHAIGNGCDIYITGDFKNHEFFDADGKIIVADIGHYESEIHTKDLFFDILTNKFSNIALNFAKTNTNPVNYLI